MNSGTLLDHRALNIFCAWINNPAVVSKELSDEEAESIWKEAYRIALMGERIANEQPGREACTGKSYQIGQG